MIAKKQTKVLIILDGWGHSEIEENNAIALVGEKWRFDDYSYLCKGLKVLNIKH
jgi:bisphosphoglycerate-independent phosphoglycerate mutase (AlkP superfamily)